YRDTVGRRACEQDEAQAIVLADGPPRLDKPLREIRGSGGQLDEPGAFRVLAPVDAVGRNLIAVEMVDAFVRDPVRGLEQSVVHTHVAGVAPQLRIDLDQ